MHKYSARIALAASFLAGCGGGGNDAQGGAACTQGSPAGCGGSVQPVTTPPPGAPGAPTTPAPVPDPAAWVASLTLVFSSNELASAGMPGSELTVSALAKTAANTAVAGAKVEFRADSGLVAAPIG